MDRDDMMELLTFVLGHEGAREFLDAVAQVETTPTTPTEFRSDSDSDYIVSPDLRRAPIDEFVLSFSNEASLRACLERVRGRCDYREEFVAIWHMVHGDLETETPVATLAVAPAATPAKATAATLRSNAFQPATASPPSAPAAVAPATAVAASPRSNAFQPATTAPHSPRPLPPSPPTPTMDGGFEHADNHPPSIWPPIGRGCFNCCGSHRARDCQQPLIYGGRGYMRCFNCTGKHPMRLCPYPMRVVYRAFPSDDY